MKFSPFKRLLLGVAACLFATLAQAQNFADKPIRILVGYAAGHCSGGRWAYWGIWDIWAA